MLMKRTLFILIALFSLVSARAVPAGTTIYLDVTQSSIWACYNTYVIYFTGRNGYDVMTPDPNRPGILSYTYTQEIPNPAYFGASDQVLTSNQAGWNAFVNNTNMRSGAVNLSAKTPYNVVDESGKITRSDQPADASVELASLTDVVCQAIPNCELGTYSLQVQIVWEGGDVCGISVISEGKTELVRSNLVSPYTYVIEDLAGVAGDTRTVGLAVYGIGGSLVGEQSLTYQVPEEVCEGRTEVDMCLGESVDLYPSVLTADRYRWNDGSDEQMLTVSGGGTYVCESYVNPIIVSNNLMSNGDFEKADGFDSDYSYIGWDLENMYSNGGGAGTYIISSSAKKAHSLFADVLPHGGNYFGLFDADKAGDAWRTSTATNPDLVLMKDSIYHFSFWAANVNNSSEQNIPAQLQFRIIYNGLDVEEYLGEPLDLGLHKDNQWAYSEERYRARLSWSDVTIAVTDITEQGNNSIGNDFALDDIMFQQLRYATATRVYTDTFIVNGRDCTEDPICTGLTIYQKWGNTVFISNADNQYTAYQWYCNGQPIAGATEQFFYDPNGLNGSYHVVVTLADGTKQASCPTEFSAIAPSAPLNPSTYTPFGVHVSNSKEPLAPGFYVVVERDVSGAIIGAKKKLVW